LISIINISDNICYIIVLYLVAATRLKWHLTCFSL